jgi:hypothetical protein
MPGYERFALILDARSGELGRAAVRLLELGIDVLYANDVDEAALLARQESGRLGAVLVPTSFEPARVAALLGRVCSQLAAGASALVAVGLEPPEPLARALCAGGAGWLLAEPYDERELRFVVSAAMAVGDERDRRKGLRVPTCVATALFMGRYRKDATLHDLSVGGAWFSAPDPFEPGSAVNVDIELPEGRVTGKARVVNARSEPQPGRADLPVGMGVAFTQLTPRSPEVLQAHVEARIRRFRLGGVLPPSGA